jgi:hypothetical protein
MATEPSSHDEEKPLPHNCDMEIELWGSILVDVGKLPVVAEIAPPVDCYREAHGAI